MQKLKILVCDIVDEVMSDRERRVDRAAVCDAMQAKPQYQTSLARGVLLYALHDLYGWSYSGIVRQTGIGLRSVMRTVTKVREMRFSDADYMRVIDMLAERLNEREYY